MANEVTKVAITPCAGVGQIFGPITREVAYNLIEEVYPEQSVLVCMPALAANVQEDLDFIKDYPVLILNGCKERCASKVVREKGGEVSAEVYLPDILRQARLSLHGESRRRLGPKSEQAIAKMTEQATSVVKTLLQGE